MAITWTAKAPGDVREYTWTPKAGESVASKTLTVSTGTATIASEIEDDNIVVTVTGGAADVVQVITASAVLNNGETITETIYLPVMAATVRLSQTGRDICSFAMRKLLGLNASADGVELTDAMLRLNGMLAAWATEGADIGVPLPLEASDTLYVEDAFIEAIRANLILRLAPLYEETPGSLATPFVVEEARRGLQRIKSALLSKDVRPSVFY